MIQDVYAEQGIGQLRLLLGHLRVEDQTEKLILVAMSFLQLIVGSSTPSLTQTTRHMPNGFPNHGSHQYGSLSTIYNVL